MERGAGGEAQPRAVRRPAHAADAALVVGDDGGRAVGKRLHHQLAAAAAGGAAHVCDAGAIRRRARFLDSDPGVVHTADGVPPVTGTCHRSPLFEEVDTLPVAAPERLCRRHHPSSARWAPRPIRRRGRGSTPRARSQTKATCLPSGDQTGVDGCLMSTRSSMVKPLAARRDPGWGSAATGGNGQPEAQRSQRLHQEVLPSG